MNFGVKYLQIITIYWRIALKPTMHQQQIRKETPTTGHLARAPGRLKILPKFAVKLDWTANRAHTLHGPMNLHGRKPHFIRCFFQKSPVHSIICLGQIELINTVGSLKILPQLNMTKTFKSLEIPFPWPHNVGAFGIIIPPGTKALCFYERISIKAASN